MEPLVYGHPGVFRDPGAFPCIDCREWCLLFFDFDEFVEFAVGNSFSIVCRIDLWCCCLLFFEVFVGRRIRYGYGHPDSIVVGIVRSRACNFCINNGLVKVRHGVVASTSHWLSSCALLYPGVQSVFLLLEKQDQVVELVLCHECSYVDVAW